jgi:hypothetical protein
MPERITIPTLVTPEVMALRVLASPIVVPAQGKRCTRAEPILVTDPRRGERPMVIDPICGGVIYEPEAAV